MSKENVEHVRRAFEAFERGGPEAVAALFDPKVEYHDLPDQPDAGVHYGHAGFLGALEQWLRPFAEYRVDLDELIDGGDVVVACVRAIGQGEGSGVNFAQSIAGVFTFREKSIVRVRWFAERDQALEAAGLSK